MNPKSRISAIWPFARRAARAAAVLFQRAAAGARKAGRIGYCLCYLTGIRTLRLFRSFGRRTAGVFGPVGRGVCRFFDWLLLRHVRAAAAECRRIGQGFAVAGRRVAGAFRRHPGLALLQVLLLPFLALRRHRKAVLTLLNIAAPAAAVLVLTFTVSYWSGLEFGLVLEYGGEKLGYIADESVYDTAAAMAAERVINTDDSFKVERVPKLTLAVVRSDELLDEAAVCDRILFSSGDSIAQASGLYIDDAFIGAVESRAQLDGVLSGILESYRDGTGGDRAEFLQKVEVLDGLYPLTSTISAEAMRTHLTAQTVVAKRYEAVKGDSYNRIARLHDMTVSELKALNPEQGDMIHIGDELLVQRPQSFLRVQVVRTVQYENTLSYQTEKVKDTSQYEGYEKVKTQGKEGLERVTAEVVYVDGVEQSRNILSSEVVREPVNKVVVVGAKKVNPNAYTGDGLSTGKFIWPMPYTRNITSPYGRRGRSTHSGIDICSPGIYGQNIIAADGGVVVKTNTSGWGMSYGHYVLIDHGGGYQTMYAHCSAVLVKPGQKVSRGQVIAQVGNTGRSTGAHLHFEVRINGKTTNPLAFVG